MVVVVVVVIEREKRRVCDLNVELIVSHDLRNGARPHRVDGDELHAPLGPPCSSIVCACVYVCVVGPLHHSGSKGGATQCSGPWKDECGSLFPSWTFPRD